MQYFLLPGCYVPKIHKAASHSIEQAIMDTHYPDSFDDYAPYTENELDPAIDIVMLMRDPIERFISAASMFHNNPIENIITDLMTDVHFLLQTAYLKPGNAHKVYSFNQIEQFCDAAQLPVLQTLRVGNRPTRTLTAEQLASVKDLYKDDIQLYETLNK